MTIDDFKAGSSKFQNISYKPTGGKDKNYGLTLFGFE